MKKQRATRATRNKPVPPIRTLTALAELVGRDKGTVSRWIKRPDWPFARKAPWPADIVPDVLRWVAAALAATVPEEATGKTGRVVDEAYFQLRHEKLREEIRRIRAQADTFETALAKERGQLLDAGEVEREWAAIGAEMRSSFETVSSQVVPLSLSHGMPQDAAATLHGQVDKLIHGILRRLTNDRAEDDEEGEGEVPGKAGPARAADAR